MSVCGDGHVLIDSAGVFVCADCPRAQLEQANMGALVSTIMLTALFTIPLTIAAEEHVQSLPYRPFTNVLQWQWVSWPPAWETIRLRSLDRRYAGTS